MKQKCNYFITELKGVTGIFIRMIFSFVIVVALLFLILSGINRASQEQDAKAIITLGVALPEEDTIFKTVIMFANSLNSLKGFCRMEACTEDELQKNIEDGRYNMGISIPADFYEKANSMQPADFTLYAPANMTLSEKKLISLLEAVERVMVVTEGGIVAMYNGMSAYDFPFSVAEMENDVTNIYVSKFMSRDDCFDVSYLSPYGDYSFLEYYAAAMILLGAMICSMGLVNHYNVEKLSFERIFFKKSGERILCSMSKVIAMGVGFSIILCMTLLIADRICETVGSSFIYAKGSAYGVMILMGMSMAVYYHLLGALFASEREGKVITMVMLTIIMPFLSGAFIPVVFFPKWLSALSKLIPFSAWHRLILEGTFGDVTGTSVISILIFDIVLLALGVVIYNSRIRKNG